ncbi:acetoacetate--CoA ligase [Teredinibacter purpureus]|uniref:acetoacetate--CoA ligase n=1 Tax=Teredinibacter purpureus TaxID=2731756 RepID=UPI0005F7C58D|nr:acetoacetate--CoA ligase [Teredinibacter purpureus]
MLWQPDDTRVQQSEMWRFIAYIDNAHSLEKPDYASLYTFSIENPALFWTELFHFFQVTFEGELIPAVTDIGFHHYGWFPNVKLNFAENLLAKGEDKTVAIQSLLENGEKQSLTYAELKQQVASLQQQLNDVFKEGNVLACYMPNIAETVIAMLATTALGGVFTSTSADFGIEGVIDRFGQSKPTVLIACAGYEYGGRYFDCTAKIASIVEQIPSIKKVIVVDRYHYQPNIGSIQNAEFWQPQPVGGRTAITYKRRAFNAPLYIVYSSGTTGKPKCIVHANGGVLLQHIKEIGLHCDHNADKTLFFFTTCGWMMWNWLVSSLYFGGTTILYEGSPAYPSFERFIRIIDDEKINIFGTSPKYLKALEDSKVDLTTFNFGTLETVLCTGAPLLPEQFDFVYNRLKRDLMLASISGGTDILGCFFLGNPTLPVYRSELQCAGLGMDLACLKPDGTTAAKEQQGELVCRKSFPSRPLYFLNDPGNDTLCATYFNTYPGVWYHGDYIAITRHGGAIFYGRSDATLNPGGVRIGTSEIYRQTETLGYIEDAVCVGQHKEGDINIVLFVKMKLAEHLSDGRIAEIKQRIKMNTTPRHVPSAIYAVHDIPYTRSGKKIELAVTRVINGQPLTNKEAIANPECLEEYANYYCTAEA